MPGLTKRIQKIIDMEGGTKEEEINKPITTEESEVKVDDNKKNLDEALPKLMRALPKGVVMQIAPKILGTYLKAVNHWLENKKGVLGINFVDETANVSEQAPVLAKALLKEARGWVKTVNEPEFEEAVEIITELVRDLIKKEIAPLLDDFVETAMPKVKKLADEQLETIEKKGSKLGRTFADIGNDSLEVAFPPLKVVNAASNIVANILTAIDVGGKVTLSGLEQAAEVQTEMMGKQSGGPLLTMARTYKKVKQAKDNFAEKIHNLSSKLESGQMIGNAPQVPKSPELPVTSGGRRKTKRRRKTRRRKRKKRTKKRALKKRH